MPVWLADNLCGKKRICRHPKSYACQLLLLLELIPADPREIRRDDPAAILDQVFKIARSGRVNSVAHFAKLNV